MASPSSASATERHGTGMFHLRLVSPEREFFSGAVWQVSVPGSEGEFGVRAGHMAFLTALKAGLVVVQEKPGGVAQTYRITGGFADVGRDQCTVLCEQIEAA